MWKQLIAPTLVVAGFWLIATLSTTAVTYWLDQSHQRLYTESRDSMQAAGDVRELVWELSSQFNSEHEPTRGGERSTLPTTIQRLEQSLVVLRGVSVTEDRRQLFHRLKEQCVEFLHRIEPQKDVATQDPAKVEGDLFHLAKGIAATSREIQEIHEQIWRAAEQMRMRWRGIVYSVRFLLLIIGPATGIAVGWWISQRLHQSISQINIILRGAGVELDQNLGKLQLSGREDLTMLREHVERLVQRMSQVNAELDAARRETLRTERLAAVGELAAGVAHELRNPLTSVKLLLQNAIQQPGETRLSDEASCVMLDEVVRMETTIQGLLDFSRPPSPQRQRHDFRDTLQRGINLVQGRAKQQRVQIEVLVPSHPLLVDGDPEQLHQVCVNLLINALEADAGGKLQIQAEGDPQDETIRVRFRDFGPGIPEGVLSHLFEPFVSTKPGGTGLGLAVSRRIVTQHGGSLSATNHPRGGAVFTLELPAIRQREIRQLTSVQDFTTADADPSAN